MHKFKAILFDLDGTLIDTALDLANALNALLLANGKESLPLSQIRPYVSDGTRKLLHIGFGIEEHDPDFQHMRQAFIQYYSDNINTHASFFDGIENILDYLDKHGIPWGIVTNKYTHLTEKLLNQLNFSHRPGCLVCGDTLPQHKPDPAPLLHAAKLLNISPSDCCYAGDHKFDIQAAKAANMYAIAALYGYIHPETNPMDWQADAYIHSPEELLLAFVQKT